MSRLANPNGAGVPNIDGTHFQSWKNSLDLGLKNENLLDVAMGTTKRPINHPLHPLGLTPGDTPTRGFGSKVAWEKQKKIDATVFVDCSDNNQVLNNIKTSRSAADRWAALCRINEAQDSHAQLYLQDKLFTLKMQEGESISQHVHNFNSLIEKLKAVGSPICDDYTLVALMRSVVPSYKEFISSSLRGNQSMTTEEVIAYLLREERKRTFNGGENSMSTISVPRSSGNASSNKSSTSGRFCLEAQGRGSSIDLPKSATKPSDKMGKKCFYCKLVCHQMKDCQKKLADEHEEYARKSNKSSADTRFCPPVQGKGSILQVPRSSKNPSDTRRKCFYCKVFGHQIKDCRKKLEDEEDTSEQKCTTPRMADLGISMLRLDSLNI